MSTVMTPYEIKPTTSLLGEIITHHTTKETPFNKVEEALKEADLDPKYAKPLRTTSAFSRAAAHLKENRAINRVDENRKEDTITFQLDKKEIHTLSDGEKRLDFDFECQITLDTKTGFITCKNPVVEAKARELFAHAMSVRTSNDITRMVQQMFKDNADLFPINPTKGVAYFVPAAHSNFTAKVEHFMELVGGKVWRFPVPKGTTEGNASVRDSVQNGLNAIIEELDETVDQWDEKTRKSTQEKVLQKYKLLRHKAQVYSEYLQHTAVDINTKLDDSKGKLIAKLEALAMQKAEQP